MSKAELTIVLIAMIFGLLFIGVGLQKAEKDRKCSFTCIPNYGRYDSATSGCTCDLTKVFRP